jgi:hypothetical protein
MTAWPRRANGGNALRLAYWNTDGIRGRKPELDQFLSEHGVDISLLNETHLESDWPFWLASYVCQRTVRHVVVALRSLSTRALITVRYKSRVCST